MACGHIQKMLRPSKNKMFGNTERSLKDRDRSAQSRPGGADETTLGGHQWQRAHVPDRLRPDSRQLGERWPSRLVATGGENRDGGGWHMPKTSAGRFTQPAL